MKGGVMNSYLFIKERESRAWILHGIIPMEHYKEGRKIRYYNKTSIYPKPEDISPFIEEHKIIESESEEESWQILNSK